MPFKTVVKIPTFLFSKPKMSSNDPLSPPGGLWAKSCENKNYFFLDFFGNQFLAKTYNNQTFHLGIPGNLHFVQGSKPWTTVAKAH